MTRPPVAEIDSGTESTNGGEGSGGSSIAQVVGFVTEFNTNVALFTGLVSNLMARRRTLLR